MARDDDNTGRNLALVAGGGALVWLVLRGGDGFGLGGNGKGTGEGAPTSAPAPSVPAPPLQIRVDASGVTVDGQPTDIGRATALTKARGACEVIVTGSAAYGVASTLLVALRTTGATISVKGAA